MRLVGRTLPSFRRPDHVSVSRPFACLQGKSVCGRRSILPITPGRVCVMRPLLILLEQPHPSCKPGLTSGNENVMTNRTILWIPEDGALVVPLPGQAPRPVHAWEEVDGRRRPSARQEVTPEGIPVWSLVVAASRVVYGRIEPELLEVRWAALAQPGGLPEATSSPWGDLT